MPWFPADEPPRPETRVIQMGATRSSRATRCAASPPTWPGGRPAAGAGRAGRRRSARRVDRAAVAERAAALDRRGHRRRCEAAAREEPPRCRATRRSTWLWLSRCDRGAGGRPTRSWSTSTTSTPPSARSRSPAATSRSPPSGGLGWGLGAALGAKLAAPDHSVICCVGDGAYIFGSPTASHFVSRAYNLPVLFVVFNNRAWNAVKRAVQTYARATGLGGAHRLDAADRPRALARLRDDLPGLGRPRARRSRIPPRCPRPCGAGCASCRKRSARSSST